MLLLLGRQERKKNAAYSLNVQCQALICLKVNEAVSINSSAIWIHGSRRLEQHCFLLEVLIENSTLKLLYKNG